MGIFDLFLSEEKKIKKHHRRLVDRDAQPEDREISARWLAENASPNALLALCARLDVKLENQLKDASEKELIYALLAEQGQKAIPSVIGWLKQCKAIATPLRLLEDLSGQRKAIEVVYELLAVEAERDDFKADRKKKLLVWLANITDEGAIEAALPFLDDFDEGVRYSAAEVLINQQDDAALAPLLERMNNPEEDSNRLRVRIAEVFATRRWTVDGAEGLADKLPEGYAIRDGRIVSA